ncbi:hypothetical protein C8R47DRAFT_1228277 [Mycena vitilis]|nr:hypothetical protein C8R47DRAFT_1228277 [Mycena vitilis]
MPQFAQELVDHCVSFLEGSVADLKASSLVQRNWVRPSQFHLFKDIDLTYKESSPATERLCRRFLAVLDRSPHLTRFITRLTLNTYIMSIQTVERLADTHFTHLRQLVVFNRMMKGLFGETSPRLFPHLQKLFRLPTIEELSVQFDFNPGRGVPSHFWDLWIGCSPNLRHLGLQINGAQESRNQTPPSLGSTIPARISLESLHVTSAFALTHWVQDARCPFDFAHITTLRIGHDSLVPHCDVFRPILGNIQLLDFTSHRNFPAFDLGVFTGLSIIRISIPTPESLELGLQTLSTLSSERAIERIEFYSTELDRTDYNRMDECLNGKPIALVHFDESCTMNASYSVDSAAFPLLLERNAIQSPPVERWLFGSHACVFI